MQKFSGILLIVLILAVGLLYYFHFSSAAVNLQANISGMKSSSDKEKAAVRLAYIDLDTIQDQYIFFKQKNQELEREKKRIDSEIESGLKKLETDRVNFEKKGSAITQVEIEQFQKQIQTRYQQLSERREQLLNTYMSNQTKSLEQINGKINTYLKEYNKTAGYQFIFSVGAGNLSVYYQDSSLNITKDVLKGLNAEFQKKGKQ